MKPSHRLALFIILALAPPAFGQWTVVHNFTAPPRWPRAPLVQGTDGAFYGTTVEGGVPNIGGAFGSGTVFKVTTDGVVTILHSFDFDNDGGYPEGGLTLGNDGSFYGTTSYAGPATSGTFFRITTNGIFTRLASFNGP